MRLAESTDYSLRVLMYCAAHPERLVTISELAEYHALSRNHLMKIVAELGRQGLLETLRGRGGGIRLLKPAAKIRLGDVIRASETDFRLAECFDSAASQCRLQPGCRLKVAFNAGLRAFFRELDGVTLADVVGQDRASAPARQGRASRAIAIPIVANTAPRAKTKVLAPKTPSP